MSTTVNETKTVELLDGKTINVRPLKISLLVEEASGIKLSEASLMGGLIG